MRLDLMFGVVTLLFALGCGDDDDVEADRLGVGAECDNDDACADEQECLPFKGGYCGVADCSDNEDCPEGSQCVAHENGENYCFRACIEKAECNRNRSAELASNCSSSITFVDESSDGKACVPPSSDTTEGEGGMKK